MAFSKAQVLDLLRYGTPEERSEFVKKLPKNSFQDTAARMIKSNNPCAVVLALWSVVQQYAEGLCPEYGALLAEALYERAIELYDEVPNYNLSPSTLSSLAYHHVKALSLMGKFQDVIKAAEKYIKEHQERSFEKVLAKIGDYTDLEQQREDYENLPSLKVLIVGALVNLQKIDEAEKFLQENDSILDDPISGIEANRLKGWINQYKTKTTTLKSQARNSPEPPSSESLLDIMKTAIDLGIGGTVGQELQKQVDQLDLSNRLDPNNPTHFNQLLEVLKKGESYLGQGNSNSELSVRNKVLNASAIFAHGTPTPEVIEHSLAVLQSSLEWVRKNQNIQENSGGTELENDALWGIYLCHSRLNQASAAADALIQLRHNLEKMRAGIKDPLKRGGVFSSYRYLFNVLCENLQKAGRAEDLLEAIESSKGRVIADRLTEKSNAVILDEKVYGNIRRLSELTQREKFHYLTYFVDEEKVYAAFVSKQGIVYAIDPIPIRDSVLKTLARNVDPRTWGGFVRGNPRNRIQDTSECLAPLVAWLEDLLQQGVLQKNDHICYSADEDFNNVPLQYLRFKDGLLLDWFSLSRIHSASHLDLVFNKEITPPPAQYLGVVVPRIEECDKEGFLDNLDMPIQWLAEHCQGDSLRLTDATLEKVTSTELDHRIIHFATHGHFPKIAIGNPYQESFLLLADVQGLPDKKPIDELGGKLTPEIIVDKNLNFQGSHVSLMACISGLAKEGIAGDTLGLEWAFIQAGASSLISTHWEVKNSCAAVFFTRFYEKWIKDGQSRASAYRETTLELLNRNYTPQSLYSWAAFSLTGDFR